MVSRRILIGGSVVAAVPLRSDASFERQVPGSALSSDLLASRVSVSDDQAFTLDQQRLGRRNLDAAPRNKATYAVDFGVRADGRTDDTEAMISAYAAAADMQGVSDLILPSGVIMIRSTLVWGRGQVSVRGAGQGATILRQGRGGIGALRIRAAAGDLFNITLSGMAIDMAVGVDAGQAIGVHVEAVINLTMTDIAVSGYRTNCMLAGCFDTSGHNCDFIGSAANPGDRVGLYITASSPAFGGRHGGNIKFTSMESRTSTGAAGAPGLDRCMVIDACDGAFFDGCYYGYSRTCAVQICKSGALVAGVTFANCWFDAHEGANVVIEGAAGPENGPIKFTGCSWVGGVRAQRNLVVTGDWTDLSVSGGSMQWATADNIYFGPSVKRVVVNGLSIALADYDGKGGGDGIHCDGASVVDIHVLMDGKGRTRNGVRLTGGKAVRVTGVITGCERAVLTEGDLDYYRIDVVAHANRNAPAIVDRATGAHKTVTGETW